MVTAVQVHKSANKVRWASGKDKKLWQTEALQRKSNIQLTTNTAGMCVRVYAGRFLTHTLKGFFLIGLKSEIQQHTGCTVCSFPK